MADAPDRRGESLGRHHSVAHVRPFDLLFPHHRCGSRDQNVGTGICPPDDGRRMAYAAEQHVARRSAHGPFRLARNRRQPSADHLLFPAGHGRAVDQRRNCRLPKKAPAFVRPPYGGTARRRHSGRRLELRASVVHDAPLEADHPRRFGTRRRRGNLPGRVGTRLRYGVELRTRRELEPADPRLHGRRFGSGVHPRRRNGQSP